MAVDIVTLGDSPEELEAARCLRGRRNIRVSGAATSVETLAPLGFVAAPESVETLVELPFVEGRVSRRMRATIARSLAWWESRGAATTLWDVRSYGRERLVNELYFPLFVRHYYARGISPYGAHNLEAFLRIARDDHLLAVAEADGRPLAAALLDPAPQRPLTLTLAGSDPGRVARLSEGLAYAVAEGAEEGRRAFLATIAAALAELDYGWFSLGRDAPHFEPRYAQVLLEKLRWAQCVVANLRPGHTTAYHWSDGAHADPQGLVFLPLTATRAPRAVGGSAEVAVAIERMLASCSKAASRRPA